MVVPAGEDQRSQLAWLEKRFEVGRSCALSLSAIGAKVVISYQSREGAASEVVARIRAQGGEADYVQADLAKRADAERLFEHAVDRFGSLDVVVANAGIWKRAPIDEMTEEQWDETIDANLRSIYHTCHFAARRMKQQGSGNIILISSTAGQRGEAFYSHYAASKGAILALTKSLGTELGPSRIRVNCVAPGWVLTDMTADVFANEKFKRAVEIGTPVGRVAEPDQIASVVLFLASDLSSHLQGEIINANGGSVMCG